MQTETTERVQRLKARLETLEHDRYRAWKPLSVFDEGASLDEPAVVRKAKALALMLRESPIYIQDDELIVGGRTLYGEPTGWHYMKPIFRTTSPWPNDFYAAYATPEEAARYTLVKPGQATAHAVVGFERVLNLGYGGLRRMARESAERVRRESPPDLERRLAFLQAAEIPIDATAEFIGRYAALARELAATATGPRQGELEDIADCCDHVAEGVPRTFREALQIFHFTRFISMMESFYCMPVGRLDQYLWPFLQRDLAAGRLDRAGALELLECLWVKCNEEVDIESADDCLRLMVGGQDAAGNDATNPLSWLCLEASVDLRLISPKAAVRLHNGTPPEFFARCMEIVRLGIGGLPEIYNDEGIIPSLVEAGIPPADARDYCHDGCSEITIGGRSDFYPVFGHLRFLKTLDATLKAHDNFASFDELLGAYKADLTTTIRANVDYCDRKDREMAELCPAPFISLTLEGCLESGLDKTWGGTVFNHTGVLGMELPNTVNALAALKRVVFEEKALTFPEMKRVLAEDFAGNEALRQRLINRAPKYGNDDPYVDEIATDVASHYIREVNDTPNPRGGQYMPGFFDFGNFLFGGKELGATPDGRKAGGFFAGHLMAVPGTDRPGVTACVRSACKITRLHPALGAMLDLKLHPSVVAGAGGLAKLSALVKTFMEQGGMALQFNIVDGVTLRAAQQEPEKYRDLMVRVWGFSTYFVDLTADMQEQIIARTEHAL